MQKKTAERLLADNRRSYERIAGEFSATRAHFWGELRFLGEHAVSGMKVLDIGCGNGRFYDVLKDRQISYTGLDNSAELLEEARRRHPHVEFVLGDATLLPFSNSSFNLAYSFAVIHHIPSRALRNKFIQETARVLHPGNVFIITSWYLWRSAYLPKLLWGALRSMFFLSPLDTGDIMLTFGQGRQARYVHAFTLAGLRRLLSKNGFEVIGSDIVTRDSGSGAKNILLVCRKKIPPHGDE